MKKPIPIVNFALIVMRSTLLQILLSVAFSGFALASTHLSFEQGILDKTVSIKAENKKLKGILIEIEKSTSIKFSFNPKSIPIEQKVSLGFHNKTLKFVLDSLLKPLDVDYEVSGNYVILSKTRRLTSEINNVYETIPAEKNVTGTVIDETGAPLPGVNVLEKGTSNGTTTDANGKFSINIKDENSVLVFSFIGYALHEESIGTRSEISISMQPDIQSLDEVVVVAYGTQQRKDLTSSITSLKAKEFGVVPVASADALLQGKAAGVQVVQNSGQPGGEVFVRIRGTNSLLGESRPLYVIDGVPMTNIDAQPLGGGGQRFSGLADINPNDIESIEILKDAAAAALYGSRGSNGVVLITTKKGKSGDAKISFDSYHGVQNVYKTFDLLGGQGYIDVINEARVNAGNPVFDQLTNTGVETDWQKEIFRPAPISNYNISVSGGSERLTAYASLGYFDQSGTIIGQEFKRINGRLNLDYQAKKFLNIGANTSFTNTVIDRVDADFSQYSVLANAVFFNPNVPVRNVDGSYGRDPLGNGFLENPVMIANDLTHNISNRRFISNVYGEISFLENFKFRSTFGIDFSTRREERFIPNYFQLANGVASSAARFYDELVWQNENTLQYNSNIDKHSFGGLLGYSLLESEASNFQINGNQTASNLIPTFTAVNIQQPNHNIGNWGLKSYFARANYSFDEKYLFEASIRRDGSSRFGRNNRFGYFPSVSAAWRISSESFMQDLSDAINDLKLRVSYGATGNQDGIDNFGSLTQYAANAAYDAQPAVYRSAVGNPDLKWETTVSTNIGIDLSLLNNRLEISADAYRRNTKDLFYSLALPQTTGFTEIRRVNLGSLENSGVEFMFTSRNLVGEFSWTTNFNIAFNRNEINELYEFNGQSDRVIAPNTYSGVEGPYGLFRVGEPTGNFYGYRYSGIWGDANNPVIPEGWGTKVQLGDARFEDVNENFAYGRNDDHQLIGNALPLHIGGITNSFAYKGVDLVIVMNWSYGNEIYNVTKATLEGMTRERNQLTSVNNRYTSSNENPTYPRPFYGSNSVSGAANTDANSRYVEDGSFLRMRNITLGYSLPVDLIGKVGLSNARIYIAGQNIVTFTNYSGLDPESQNLGISQGSIPAVGVDFLTQPLPRTFMIGLNIGF